MKSWHAHFWTYDLLIFFCYYEGFFQLMLEKYYDTKNRFSNNGSANANFFLFVQSH
jgi:hypothetical protein